MAGFDLGRTDGMMLAVAIGDALGSTTESLTPADRVRMHGEIRDDLVNRHAGGRGMGLPSDDSQLAFAASDVSLTRSHGSTCHSVLRTRNTRHERSPESKAQPSGKPAHTPNSFACARALLRMTSALLGVMPRSCAICSTV